MNELEELRSHLADSSPEALEHARERLHAAQRDSPRPLAGGVTAAPRRRQPRRSAIQLGAVGLAVAAAVSIALLVGIGPGSGGGDSPLTLAPASARTVLVRAAASAALADDGGIPRMPRPDEYFFVEIRGTYRDGIGGGATRLNTRMSRLWLSEARTGRASSPASPTSEIEPQSTWFIGNERFSGEKLGTFAPKPRALYERLLKGVSPGQGSSPQAEVFVQLVDALRQAPLPPHLRSTFLLALAEIPGLQLTGPTKDSLGRPGLGVAYVERSREDQQHELILGRDGALLAERATTRDGKLLQDTVIVRQAITTDLKVPAG